MIIESYSILMRKIIIYSLAMIILVGCFFYFDSRYDLLKSIIVHPDELTTEEIATISRSIAAVQCTTFKTLDNRGPVFGSGTYLTVREPQTNSNINVLLTNSHVAEDPRVRNSEDDYGNCSVVFNQTNRYHFFNFKDTTVSNDNQDFTLLTVDKDIDVGKETPPLSKNNGQVPFCKNIVAGMKLYIFGYPGSADSYILSPEPREEDFKNIGEWSKNFLEWQREMDEYNKSRNLILTEGIISGKNEKGYFTTAKIDTGNSGGLAISKENNKVCLVGIPTWASVGEIDSLGIIQPIENIYGDEINWKRLLKRVSLPLQ